MIPFDVVTGRDDMVSQGGSVTTLVFKFNCSLGNRYF